MMNWNGMSLAAGTTHNRSSTNQETPPSNQQHQLRQNDQEQKYEQGQDKSQEQDQNQGQERGQGKEEEGDKSTEEPKIQIHRQPKNEPKRKQSSQQKLQQQEKKSLKIHQEWFKNSDDVEDDDSSQYFMSELSLSDEAESEARVEQKHSTIDTRNVSRDDPNGFLFVPTDQNMEKSLYRNASTEETIAQRITQHGLVSERDTTFGSLRTPQQKEHFSCGKCAAVSPVATNSNAFRYKKSDNDANLAVSSLRPASTYQTSDEKANIRSATSEAKSFLEKETESRHARQTLESSFSGICTTEEEYAGQFLQELRLNSQGALPETKEDLVNTTLDSESNDIGFNTAIRHSATEEDRRRIQPISSGDTHLIENTSPSPLQGETHPMDDTVIMTLSDSDSEEDTATRNDFSDAVSQSLSCSNAMKLNGTLDWDQKLALDDNIRHLSQRKHPLGNKVNCHRRSEGAVAAASPLLGIMNRQGMEEDQTSMKNQDDDDEEDDLSDTNEIKHFLLLNPGKPRFSIGSISSSGLPLGKSSSGRQLGKSSSARQSISSSSARQLVGNTARQFRGEQRERQKRIDDSDHHTESSLDSASTPLHMTDQIGKSYDSKGSSQFPHRLSNFDKQFLQNVNNQDYMSTPLKKAKRSFQYDDSPNIESAYSSSENSDRAGVLNNQIQFQKQFRLDQLEQLENQMRQHAGNHRVFRAAISPRQKSHKLLDRRYACRPQHSVLEGTAVNGDAPNEKEVHTYICPRCKTRQREFFTTKNAPRQFESASGYLALYFAIYVIASLYIFGLEEGWAALDCIYFAVITLTTAGLGDFVPTTDGNKIICTIFIYFGVACIGLLLGSYIAGMLDEISTREAKQNRLDTCPNCARMQNLRNSAKKRQTSFFRRSERPLQKQSGHIRLFQTERGMADPPSHALPELNLFEPGHKRQKSNIDAPSRIGTTSTPRRRTFSDNVNNSSLLVMNSSPISPTKQPYKMNPNNQHNASLNVIDSPRNVVPPLGSITGIYSPVSSVQLERIGSPSTQRIFSRQNHTRHYSLDVNNRGMSAFYDDSKHIADDLTWQAPTTIKEGDAFVSNQTSDRDITTRWKTYDNLSSDDNEDSSSTSTEEILEDESITRKVTTAKNVFLTLKQALMNSLVIIVLGCLGFWLIEGFSLIDSWYFTTVLLTTVGYGDIAPVTQGGKLFATIYILVAGTILLNNMSMISMIPLELRQRRIERAVLTQFGDQLDDDALRELATGPLIERLHLSMKRPDGLNECTREMFAIAMLVRLGKVSEQDVIETLAAFNRLDANKDGVLNSKTIIEGMISRRRAFLRNLDTARPSLGTARKNGSNSAYWMRGQYPLDADDCEVGIRATETSSLLSRNR